ncbi:hypothetical protein [Clostridium arbusti]|nr:hypothetical protein [Clostridium arbusti]
MVTRGIKLYWNVVMASALPAIISGIKQGWSLAWRASILSFQMSFIQTVH